MNKRKMILAAVLCTAGLFSFSFGVFEPIKGTWSNPNGQTIRFGKGNQCEWIFSMAGRQDTFRIPYHYEKTGKQTGILDLGPFDRGSLKGRTLYGIVEWLPGRKAFKYDAEPGKTDKVRPTALNADQLQVYTRQ
ncbi:MAG: hypothetical protein MUF62_05725 [Chitinophagaceae bacterium]|jgi:hypothetical protein|nr:hypothetical protein [Chitinophagaceae bacterium]